jgi:hypothetical protein
VENINKYQAETIKWRDRKVRLKKYQANAFGALESSQSRQSGKITPKVGRTFLVVSLSRPGSYRLKDMDGNNIPRSWNADELRQYYV